ncbi:uncharacterized protein NESG_00966 [Nematocida ausubeli]|uniref:C2 domain-containing protein n=1 Tax=Nematocida ausubeli (strain ATCC PRA-371 / ERTm2) TaxID=1913371 RepID=A0A086J3U2_NEMA1|nr:uncharacterized protein NESG_00966 [Nematocida ausubeli]KAI5134711.1 hypothetical protein NEAUS07_0915 [Nematocida ausubeli]KFG26810.1 hypothetical protein NESG_00966 [Nematocida ausubeli]
MQENQFEEDELLKEERISAEKYAKSLAKYENALALDQPSTFMKVLKVPGIVFFAVVGGYILGWLEFRPWVIIPLLYIIGFVFIMRIKEFKRSMEAFVYFSIRKQTVSKYEKVDWMNEVTEKAWRFVESTLSKVILLRISTILRKVKVPMVSDIRLDRFTLGGQAPVIEGIRIRQSCRDSLIVDATMHFIPSVSEELQTTLGTPGDNQISWNSNITFTIRVGGSSAGIDMPVTLKNMSFRGSMRIKLNFTYDASVIEGVEFSFLKQPIIEFNIVPLKMLDIMDVPGLGTAIKKVIELGIAKEMLYPKRISVALKPKSKYYVGAISVHIHRVCTKIKKDWLLSVGLNGRKGQFVTEITGEDTNYVAYLPIKNIDDLIYIFIQGKEEKGPASTATLSIERICMQSRMQGIFPFSNRQGYIDASFLYHPKIDVDNNLSEETPKSAIVTVKLAQLIDMVDVMGMPYKSLTVRATVYMRQKRTKNKDPAYMSATELMPEENDAVSPGFSVTNESSTDSDEELKKNPDKKTPENEELGVFTTSTARNITSPAFDEKFVFFTRDTKRTIISIEALEKKRVIGSFSVNIRRGISISYGTFDFWHMPAGRAKLLFSAEYSCMTKIKMQKYTHIRVVKVNSIETEGVFSGYLVTSGRVVPVEPFFSHCTGEYSGLTLVPLLSTEEITKYVAYMKDEVYGGCDVISGESYIGDSRIDMDVVDYALYNHEKPHVQAETEAYSNEERQETAEPSKEEDKEMEASSIQHVHSGDSSGLNEDQDTPHMKSLFVQMRVVVCRVNHPIFLEFSKGDVVVDRSVSSSGKKLHGEFFFFSSDVTISVFTVKEGFLIGKFHLCKPSGRHEIKLTHGQLFVIDVNNRYYKGPSLLPIQAGTLSVTILEMKIAELQEPNVYSSIFIEIVVGDKSKITKPSEEIMLPKFNETFEFPVFTPLDRVEIKVYGWTLLKEKKFLGETELPSKAIPLGTSSFAADIPAMSIDSTAAIYKLNANMILYENGRV